MHQPDPHGLDHAVGDFLQSVGAHEPAPELTTVGTGLAVVHQGTRVHRFEGLAPGKVHELDGFRVRTLSERGELLARFATVNDVHFGEEVCGMIEGSDIGPQFRSPPDVQPYPEMMNQAAVAEMASVDLDAVLVKGDLTSTGTRAEYDAFLATYETAFEDRLLHVRGNHESFNHAEFAAWPFQVRELPGATLVLLDTSIDGDAAGTVTPDQLDQLDELASRADRAIYLFGHHHLGDRTSADRTDRHFGIDVDASEALRAVVARRPAIRGYFAGHTHRNRVRHFEDTRDVPWVEVACVKDYPGAWAEYQVYEGGMVQVHHRISDPRALAWSEQTRHMFAGLYHDYAFGGLADRCFAVDAEPMS